MGVVCTLLSVVPPSKQEFFLGSRSVFTDLYRHCWIILLPFSILVPGELWWRVLNNCNRQVVSILRILAGYLPLLLSRETRDNNGECNGEWRREGRIIFLSPPPLSYLGVHRSSSTRTIRLSTGYLHRVDHPTKRGRYQATMCFIVPLWDHYRLLSILLLWIADH